MHFAGLWDRWRGDERVIESFTVIVGPANRAIRQIHDRQPMVIPRDKQDAWLDRKLNDANRVMELLASAPEDALKFHRVGTAVNNSRNEGEGLVQAVDEVGSP
jgi:putative SOS response-associated peptidase YedK